MSGWRATQTVNDGRWTVLGPVWWRSVSIRGPLTTRPNAEVMSAAPELLEAAMAAVKYDAAIQRAAVKHGVSWVGVTEPDAELDALYQDWIDKARAAIEKAEGRA